MNIQIMKIKSKITNGSPVVKASFWFMVCSVLQKCISLISTPLFTRLLTSEEYGIFTVYNSWYQVFLIFISLKLDGGVFNKGMSKYSDNKDEYTETMQGITTITCVILAVVFLIFKKMFTTMTELRIEILLLMVLHLLFTEAISFWSLRERYDYKYKKVVVITLLMAFSNCGLGVLLVLVSNGNKGIARIISIIIVQIIFGIGIYFVNLKKTGKFIVSKYAKFAVCFNIPLIPHYLSMYIMSSSDRIMIQKMCGTTEVALYGVVYNLALVLQFVVDSLNSSLAPWLYKKMEEKNTKDIEKIILFVGFGIMLVLSGFILVAPEVVYLMAGNKYLDAVTVMPCITTSILCIFIYQLIGNIEFYYDANKFTMYVSMIGAVFNIILNYIAIPIWGYWAAGYTTLICYLIFVIAHAMFAARLSRKKENKVILSPLKITALCITLSVYAVFMSKLYAYTVIRYVIAISLIFLMIIKRKRILSIWKALKLKR